MSVILVGGLDDYLIKVAEGLVKRGVPISHLLDRYQRPASREGILKGVLSIDAQKFIAPERIRRLNRGQPPVLDAALVATFERAELVWLSVSDRYTHSLSVAERRRLFRDLLEYFYRWLQTGEIQAIIFPNVPHAGWNNILYFVAKHFNIATLILEPTRLNDRVVVWDDYELVHKVPADFMAEAGPDVIRQHIDPAVLNELSVDSSWMIVSNEINREALRRSGAGRELVAFIRAAGRGIFQRQRPRDLLLDEPWSWWKAHWHRYALQRRARYLRMVYEGLAMKHGSDKPYILFFLNYQPEKTTTPMGGLFDDQLLAIRLLAAALPTGWRVLVKEHPRQFDAHVDAFVFRSEAFYQELAAEPRVQLVSFTAPTEELIAHCQATATVTGSIGWQGLLAGKPAINFGRSWYGACRSCYVVSSVADIKSALALIQQQKPTEVEQAVLKFLAYERSEFILGGNGDRYVAHSKRSPAELAESLAEAIAARLTRSPQPAVQREAVRVS